MTAAEMAALHARAFTVPRPWTAGEFADFLASVHVFAVCRPGGFALARVIAGEAELLTIAVDPDARRRGTGAALLAEVEAGARLRHAERLFLEVAEDNAAARALYARAGLVADGRRPGYYRHADRAVDALILSKSLAD